MMASQHPERSVAARGGPPGSAVQRYIQEFNVRPNLKVPMQTVPVQTPRELAVKRNLTVERVLKFNERSPVKFPNLELHPEIEPYAGRYLSPNAPFPIVDPSPPIEGHIEYPSILHFLGGKMVEYATDNPDMYTFFTRDGSIHAEWNAARQAARGKNLKITEDQARDFLVKEYESVLKKMTEIRNDPSYKFNATKWQSLQIDMLQVAVHQRMTYDKRFCAILAKATEENKYLLYASEDMQLGGKYNSRTRKVEGVNLYGTIIMDIIKSNPTILEKCMTDDNEIKINTTVMENVD